MYTEEEILDEIRRVSEEECGGKTPRRSDFSDLGFCNEKTVERKLDCTWNEAMKLAGVGIREPEPGYIYNENEIREEIFRVSEMCDGAPTIQKFNEESYIHHSTVCDRFDGGWPEIMKQLGISPQHDVSKLNREEVIYEFERISEEYCNGESVNMEMFNRYAECCCRTAIRSLGCSTWNEALEKLGFSKNHEPSQKHSIEELIESIEKFWEIEEGKFTVDNWREWHGSSPAFGDSVPNWTRLVDVSEVPIKEALLSELEEYKEDFGEEFYVEDFDSFGRFSTASFSFYFDSLENAISESELSLRNISIVYGSTWEEKRKEIWERDGYKCRVCSKGVGGTNHHVHHIKPVRKWDIENNLKEMNSDSNLITLCSSCHKKLEGKWQSLNPDEFEMKAKEYLGMVDGEDGNNQPSQSVFDF